MKGLALLVAAALSATLASCRTVSDRSTIDLDRDWQFRRAGESSWRAATVPGCVHTDLLARGLIGDPFAGANEKDLQWIEESDWEYRTFFSAGQDLLARENIELQLDGLDTYAEVYLNDVLLLSADNMFRRWRVPCEGHVWPGRNELRIRFRSPVAAVAGAWRARGRALPGGPRVLTRKAAYQYGWDWSPRFVTCGIWRPVRLVSWDAARIVSLSVRQDAVTDSAAALTIRVATESTARARATISIVLDNETFRSVDVDLAPGTGAHEIGITIPDPELWWPNGLGGQHRYRLLAELREGGRLLDWRDQQVGIRTVELVREPDAAGTSFSFVVNGVPLYMKGANYVPQDSFLPRVSRDRYDYLIAFAAAAGMNMLRVWGGGVYEDDVFYDLCDEYGILVWQDFMFACGMYPADTAFVENVRREAIDNVDRLRGHPCLALWCGNNEIDEGWHHWGWQRELGYSAADSAAVWADYESLFHTLLPAVVAAEDPGRPYWPSSPSYGRAEARSFTEGDAHDWRVWHDGAPFESFATRVPRFMSEFGFQSFPSIGSIARFALPREWHLDSDAIRAHQKAARGNEIMRDYILRSYRTPRDFASFVYLSQVCQAAGLRIGIEAERRAKPRCMGSLFWQLDDCWPAASWSSIDYYGEPKALWYAARDAFADVLISPVIENDTVRVFAVSDLPEDLEGALTLSLLDFRGNPLWESTRRVTIEAGASRPLFADAVSHILAGESPAGVVLSAELFEGGDLAASNLLYFAPPKDVHLLPVEFSRVDVVPAGGADAPGAEITIETGVLARSVYLAAPGFQGYFSDNYFDMLPGTAVTVRFFTDDPVEDLGQWLTIRTLADTY